MHLHQLIFVLVSMGWVSEAQNCSAALKFKAKQNLFAHLGLDNNSSENNRMWPLIFNKYNYFADHPITIYVNLYVTSIINVNEKDQSLTTQVKMITAWQNWNWRWDETLFCGIKTFSAPKNMFWTPDIGIMESIKTEFGTKESPNVLLLSNGSTASSDFFALTTACKMDLYKFPFDTQNCNITFLSTTYTNQELKIDIMTDQGDIIYMSKQNYQVQGEWELLNISYTKATLPLILVQMDQLIYQITIKRRPLLYVINIIVPVFLFLVLDLTSFFIDTNGSDKLSFKVTLLLSISVMLLLVNDTLPSTADKIPLIGVYCGAVFCLMSISIVETVFVNYLMAKGAEKRSVETTATVSGQEDSVRDQNGVQSFSLNHLKQILTECRAATQGNQQEKTCLTWTRVARIIDNIFLVLYIITVIVFLSVLGSNWIP
ncbi:5-hydroxytryptamine receptor 3A-like [Pseudorasbora parva]|uniref:5-hydroxytryptamine receptor 3A-like n=1 Tax=Pseudorasbora parva TaxID=51549 RepID=UPI00351E8C39